MPSGLLDMLRRCWGLSEVRFLRLDYEEVMRRLKEYAEEAVRGAR